MPQSFAMRIFNTWLEENRHRFHYPPIAIIRRKHRFSFCFSGIAPSIQGCITHWGGMVISVEYQGETWEFIADLDMAPERLGKGQYVCRFCEENAGVVYPTREALWIEHGFETILAWCNERFQPGLQVVLCETNEGGGRWVELEQLSDRLKVARRYKVVAEYPLFLR